MLYTNVGSLLLKLKAVWTKGAIYFQFESIKLIFSNSSKTVTYSTTDSTIAYPAYTYWPYTA